MNIRLAQTRSPWATLALLDMTVSSPSCRLYRNGRQQVEVTVRWRALDANGERVALSDAQRDSIRLVDYDTGLPLPAVPPSGEMTRGWGATRVRNRYAFFPERDARPPDEDARTAGAESVVWYVQTTDTRSKKIGCQVRRDDGVLSASAAGGAQPFVELKPERLPSQDFARSIEYRSERESAFLQNGGRGHPTRDVDYHYCSVYVDGQRLALLSFDVTPASLLHCDGGETAGGTFCFTGFAAPGSMPVRYALPSMFDAHRHRIVARPRVGEGVIVSVCGEGPSDERANSLPWQSCEVDAIDEFGSVHALRIAFDDAPQRPTLVLTRR